jgi:GNAT superfamily N-acetyltransferase
MRSMHMEIAFFRQEQLESVVDLLHEMSLHYNRDNASSRDVVKANLIDNILGADSGVRLVIASETSRAVGLATISLLYPAPKERGQLFMKELYVVSDKRGAGVGRALMHWTAKYAVSKNCGRLDWTVDDTNPQALSFYRELGATHVAGKLYFRFSDEQLLRFATGNADSGRHDS